MPRSREPKFSQQNMIIVKPGDSEMACDWLGYRMTSYRMPTPELTTNDQDPLLHTV